MIPKSPPSKESHKVLAFGMFVFFLVGLWAILQTAGVKNFATTESQLEIVKNQKIIIENTARLTTNTLLLMAINRKLNALEKRIPELPAQIQTMEPQRMKR